MYVSVKCYLTPTIHAKGGHRRDRDMSFLVVVGFPGFCQHEENAGLSLLCGVIGLHFLLLLVGSVSTGSRKPQT